MVIHLYEQLEDHATFVRKIEKDELPEMLDKVVWPEFVGLFTYLGAGDFTRFAPDGELMMRPAEAPVGEDGWDEATPVDKGYALALVAYDNQ